MSIEVYNNQSAELISALMLENFTRAALKAFPLAIESGVAGRGILSADLDVEISIVDDVVISQVHLDFMGIPGATDVITFSHGDRGSEDAMGELIISAETARSHGADYGQTFETELMLYIIHGLLHLAGHEDEDPADREAMESIQFNILEQVWSV